MLEPAKNAQMPKFERARVMNLLWESFANDDEELKSPDRHHESLEKRAKKIESGETQFLSLDELNNRFRSRISNAAAALGQSVHDANDDK
jgi:putative addiction module component (TIGR02574 family)